MSFKDLDADELKKVAEFFIVDVEAADAEKPTKKELVAALAAGDDPVTWEQYNDLYLKAKAAGLDKAPESNDLTAKVEDKPAPAPVDTSNYVLVKFQGKNPRFDAAGHTFRKDHPFASVDPETAEFLVKKYDNLFRLALPSELTDYYN
jgi:hypothetical protein